MVTKETEGKTANPEALFLLCSGSQAALFEVLKYRLLLRRLDEIPNSESHPAIIEEANTAAILAGLTTFPLLVFPCLFEERARAAWERDRRQHHIYWRALRQ